MFHAKRRLIRSVVGTTGFLAASALALSGCSAPAPSNDGGSATEGTIQWWSWTPDNDLAQREIAEFNKEFPNIKVTFKKVPNADYTGVLRPALASNDGPDVFTVAASGAVGPVNVFAPYAQDLTPAIAEKLGSDWKSQIAPTMADAFTVQGKLAGLPWAKQGAGKMWINKDLFDKYGLSAPTTLQEWVKVCETFRANGHGCFKEGVGGSGFDVDTLHSIANSVEPGAFTAAARGEKKWTDPAMVKAWEIFKQLSENGILDEGAVGVQQYPDVNNAFLTGKVPMVQMGYWYSQYATVNSLTAALSGAGVPADTPKITIVPVPFPDVAGKGNPSTVFSDPDAAQAVNTKSKSRNAATTFALWLGGSKAGQQVVANNVDSIPTLNGVEAAWDSVQLVNPEVQTPLLREFAKETAESTEPRQLSLAAVHIQAVIDANQALLTGQRSPSQVAEDVQSVADANPVSK
ncbi:ABC transporter substrate-binding protein [Pseudarthrobacter sp. MDT3-28]|uniref:ABC transporter substrate-binding protein n=1 Tax=Pseudarthrobacter raffinosi TaxID=2953651 RepID=UPI00208ED136|nr:ABC transporter substrate-binding protein [Pseudarthrobacter sp. MDT3-28]MCO4239244.1 ABC transporter substrate-binding protein [Pseudarthrobacter sp. MDT3-28]